MKSLLIFCASLLLLSGCTKHEPGNALQNKLPKTFLWLAPDSTLSQGPSKEHIYWWGSDADGFIKGYLFADGKFAIVNGHASVPANTAWRWRTATDTLVAFPLLVKRDTFEVVVRSVDNTLLTNIRDGGSVFLSPFPYWDVNNDSVFDAGDVRLTSLGGAMDPVGATLGIPVYNQPPSVSFAQNPNGTGGIMSQPDTTYTAVTFAWVGTDPDGDNTIMRYEFALNDPNDSTRIYYVPAGVTMVSFVVPRSRPVGANGEVDADVYTGNFLTRRLLPTPIHGMRLDTLNTFYIRARDIAGDTSHTIASPDPTSIPVRHWFVKNPHGKLLLVNDFITNVTGNRDAVLQTYVSSLNALPGTTFQQYEILDIARGLGAGDKQNGTIGGAVPPFIDPAFLFTLQLFDVVIWYTDPWPSLPVAQLPLFDYIRDPTHSGKVVFSTMFQSAIDPRGALRDFAPIDSVSSVDLLSTDRSTGKRLVPSLGDTRLTGGIPIPPDSSNPANIFPMLNVNGNASNFFSVFLRPVYARADARYLYHVPPYQPNPVVRYAWSATLNELKSAGYAGSMMTACGSNGIILTSTDAGQTWAQGKTQTAFSLNGLKSISASSVIVVGDSGTILGTSTGGVTWNDYSVPTFQNLQGVDFVSPTNGLAAGTAGLMIRTTDGGVTWTSHQSKVVKALRAVAYADPNVAVAVGDTAVTRTTDGGLTWTAIPSAPRLLYSGIRFVSPTVGIAVSHDGSIAKSTDAGLTWGVVSTTPSNMRGVAFADASNGWICANLTNINDPRGVIYTTADGGTTWSAPVLTPVWQHLDATVPVDAMNGWCTGTGGVIVHTSDGGTTWATQPAGQINFAVEDGSRSFIFVGLPLHVLNGGTPGTNDLTSFFNYVLFHEFGFQ